MALTAFGFVFSSSEVVAANRMVAIADALKAGGMSVGCRAPSQILQAAISKQSSIKPAFHINNVQLITPKGE